MMAVTGSIGGIRLRIDPDTVSWNFSVKTAVKNTLGGQVIQVFGVKLGEMTLSGSFGRGGFAEQARFADSIQKMALEQARKNLPPHRFILPSRKWDFEVYIRALTSPDGTGAQVVRPEIVNPKWTLRLFIVEENGNLKKASADSYISRLTAGIGWKPGPFNGPLTAEEANTAAALAATKHHPPTASPATGGGGAPGGGQVGGPTGGGPATTELLQKFVDLVKSEIGVPYRWGGADPSGFDCSGLMFYCAHKVGITLGPRTADGMWKGLAHTTAPMPGDLVFFGTPSHASHVGMVSDAGGANMVNAPRTGALVRAETTDRSNKIGYARLSVS